MAGHSKTTKIGNRNLSPESLMMGYGYDPMLSEGSLKPPIFLTSTFVFESAAAGKRFFEGITGARPGGSEGLIYGRFNGPDQEILEDRLALWESADKAAVFSTGMSAIHAATMLLRSGDHVVAGCDLYGGAYRLLHKICNRAGIDVTLVTMGRTTFTTRRPMGRYASPGSVTPPSTSSSPGIR